MRKSGFYLLFIFFMLLGSSQAANAQVTGETFTIQPYATVSWSEMLQKQALRPYSVESQKLRVIPFMPMPLPKSIGTPRQGYIAPFSQQYQSTAPATAFPSFGLDTGFQALPDNGKDIPPDTMGAVGPNYVMTMLNSQVRIQEKTGTSVSTVSLSTFWNPVSSSPFDPILIYDSLSSRWIAISDSGGKTANSNSKILFAISQTGDPAGTWNFYSFRTDANGINWADYPRVGINSKWIAITANMFDNSGISPVGSKMWVIDKSTAIAGGVLTYIEFPTGFDDTGSGSDFTLTPAVTFDSGEENLYIVDNGLTDSSGNQLIRLSEISGTASAPTWSVVPDSNGPFPGSGLFYVVNNYNWAQIKAAQKGTSNLVDSGDTRIINAVFRSGRLWFTHTGGLPAVGTADRTAIFWYQVDPALLDSTGNPIVQSGVIDPGSGGSLMFPSIAVNKNDDAVIGFSRSNANIYAQSAYVSRSASNPLGSMSQIKTIKTGEASYSKNFGSGPIRWGDYSATVVDPTDVTTFWTIQEYAAEPVPGGTSNDDRWGTWWGKITPSDTVNTPPVANAGPDQNVATYSTVTLDGSGSSDADGDLLTYKWSFTSKPPGSSATLSDATAVKPTFTTDVNGSYVISLVVNDGTVNSTADSVTITAATSSSTADLSIPNSSAAPSSTVSIPINVNQANGIAGFQLTVTFDSNVLKATGASAGNLDSGWLITPNTSTVGQITIGGFSSNLTPLSSGSGSIVKIEFKVTGQNGDSTNLTFTNSKLTDKTAAVIPSQTQTGTFKVAGMLGDINGDGTVDISDVILCLRQAVGLDTPNPSVADMNGDGIVDISDVILILRKAIGLS